VLSHDPAMRWPWAASRAATYRPLPSTPADVDEARSARVRSTDDYLATIGRNAEIHETTDRLRRRREANHFSALLEANGWGHTR